MSRQTKTWTKRVTPLGAGLLPVAARMLAFLPGWSTCLASRTAVEAAMARLVMSAMLYVSCMIDDVGLKWRAGLA